MRQRIGSWIAAWAVIAAFFACVLGGCAGATSNSAITALVNSTAQSAATLEPMALAGTLSAADALNVCLSVGEFAKTIHENEQATNLWNYSFGTGHGFLVTDPFYQPALNELLANMLARADLAIGRWAGAPPDAAYLNASAAESLRDVLIVQAMLADKTTATVSLKAPKAKKLQRATTVPVNLLDIIAAKLPAGWIAAYNALPANVKNIIAADLPIVANWAAGQLAQWWANVQAGDTVAARELVVASMADAPVQTTGVAAGAAAVAAINAHVANETALLKGVGDFVLALIPFLLGLL